MTKRVIGEDVFKEGFSPRREKILEKELKPKGQVKVSLLLTPKDVEKIENLQLLLNQKGYGKYSKPEIVRIAIRKLRVSDFAKGAE